MVVETISSFFEHFLTVMALSIILVQFWHEKSWWVAGNYQVYVSRRSAYLVENDGQDHMLMCTFGFFTIRKFDAFLSDYLTDLKLHRTK